MCLSTVILWLLRTEASALGVWVVQLELRNIVCGITVSSVDQAKWGRLAHAFWQQSQLTALSHTCHSRHAGFLLMMCANYFHSLLWITLEISGYWTLFQLPRLVRDSFLFITDTFLKSTWTSVYHFSEFLVSKSIQLDGSCVGPEVLLRPYRL